MNMLGAREPPVKDEDEAKDEVKAAVKNNHVKIVAILDAWKPPAKPEAPHVVVIPKGVKQVILNFE